MEAKERGNRAFQSGEWQAAAALYTAALDEDPRLVAAYANRAACEIHLREWQRGLADCNAALALDPGPALRVKVLWRKAVCLRHLGEAESEWTAAVQEGLALDAANEKLRDEQRHIFVKRSQTMPSQYTPDAAPAPRPTASTRQAAAPAPARAAAGLFMPPPRPLSYSGMLKLTRSKSEAAYEFWYAEVSGTELVEAHKSGGIEPDTLDYIHEMVAAHPQNTQKNLEFMRALPQCARYTSASLLADETLSKKARAAVGWS